MHVFVTEQADIINSYQHFKKNIPQAFCKGNQGNTEAEVQNLCKNKCLLQ